VYPTTTTPYTGPTTTVYPTTTTPYTGPTTTVYPTTTTPYTGPTTTVYTTSTTPYTGPTTLTSTTDFLFLSTITGFVAPIPSSFQLNNLEIILISLCSALTFFSFISILVYFKIISKKKIKSFSSEGSIIDKNHIPMNEKTV